MLARSYLRASTDEQDAVRARAQVETFAAEHDLVIAGTYVENESGAKLARPELFRLIADSKRGDVLLVEQVDRLSRLTDADWTRLKSEIAAREVRIVALDLPTSWAMTKADVDQFTSRMFAAINGMLLDMLAAMARKDYEDRRRRQAEGIAKNKDKFKGRPADQELREKVTTMLGKGMSWTDIQRIVGCARSTISRIAKEVAAAKAQDAAA
jgi:DNA invertase Pin-like site-specific DNA recombinase